MPTPDQLLAQRQRFPALQHLPGADSTKAYFNYGGQGPLSQDAIDRLNAVYTEIQHRGPFSLGAGSLVQSIVQELRQTLAHCLGVSPETIALTENVSSGCNIGLWSIPWQAGDTILLSDCEHPSVIATVQELQARFGLTLQTCSLLNVQSASAALETIAAALTPTTRAVVLSHVLWNTGFCLPLEEISQTCRQFAQQRGNPLYLIIDAAQSAGLLPLNLAALDVDFYAFTGHKWWCGPEGVGGLYVSPETIASLTPAAQGWRGLVLDEQGQIQGLKPSAARFEVATSAYPLYAALSTALAIHDRWGTDHDRFQRILHLSQGLWQELQQRSGITCLLHHPPQSGLVSFRWERGSSAQLVRQLEDQGIFLRKLANPDCVRACVHYLTLEGEIDRLLAALS
ncbi:MAG: aminotransferase class V-fold PLP-dependent enzyme [Prochlorotrichaceae cyanobacterium]